jgi:predicted nucleotidyltransferase
VAAPLEQTIADTCRAHPDVAAVYLFGSVARGAARPDSDVDVAVLFTHAPPHRLNSPRFELAGELERALGAPVDLVVLNDAPADLAVRVLRTGTLVLERDASSRIAFEVRTRNEAFDLESILVAYRAPRADAR